MNTLRALLSTHAALPAAQRQLLWCAAIVAVSLLSFYVHLLHESVAVGEQLRAQQRAASQVRPLKPSVAPTRLAEQRTTR